MSLTARRALLAVTLVVQLIVLYWPRVPGPPGLLDLPGLDKLIHMVIFAAVAWTGLRAGCRARWWLPLMVLHAGVSEVLQASVLPHRSGDWWDVVADVAGVCLGGLLGAVWVRRGPGAGIMDP